MKQNHHQVERQNSRRSAAPQPKTAHSRAGDRPASASPCIALFPDGDGGDGGISSEVIDMSKAEYAALKRAAAPARSGILMFMANAALEKVGCPGGAGHQPAMAGDTPSCLCLFDASVGELAGEIPLVGRELHSVVIAACRQRISVDQFLADAIKEKLHRDSGTSTSKPVQPAVEAGQEDAHAQLEVIVPQVIMAIQLLSDAYWTGFNLKNEYQTRRANGLISLAGGASSQLEEKFPLACDEWRKVCAAAQPDDQRSAACRL